MTGAVVGAVVVAVLFVAFAVQVTARQLQRYPVDSRMPGPLIDTSRTTSWVVRPAELEQLSSIVAESMASDAVARSKLEPLLRDLERAAPHQADGGGGASAPDGQGGRRRRRSHQLEVRLARLEAAWRIDAGR